MNNEKPAPEAVCLGKSFSGYIEGIVQAFALAELTSELYENDEQFLQDVFSVADYNLPRGTLHRELLKELWESLERLEKDYYLDSRIEH
jgi:hypothetical protein